MREEWKSFSPCTVYNANSNIESGYGGELGETQCSCSRWNVDCSDSEQTDQRWQRCSNCHHVEQSQQYHFHP